MEDKDTSKLTKDELLGMLKDMALSIENMPAHARFSYCTQADLSYALMLIHSVFISDK